MRRDTRQSRDGIDRRLGRRGFLGLSALTAGSVALGGVGSVASPVSASLDDSVFDTPGWSSFRSVLSTDDGYLLTGTRGSRARERVGWGVWLDEEFDEEWNCTYLSLPHLRSTEGGEDHSGLEFALPGRDGGFLLVGWWHDEGSESRYGWITRVGDEGVSWWSRVYDREDVNSFRDDFADGVVTDDGHLLVGRTIASEYDDEERGDGWVVEIDDREGRVLWERAYDPAGPVDGWADDERHSEFNAVTAVDDGYLVVGETSPDGPTRDTNTAAWALRLDEDGDPLTDRGWSEDGRTYRLDEDRDWDNEFRDVVAVDDGYLVAGVAGQDEFINELKDTEMRGRAWAAKLDERGRLEWQDDPDVEGFHAVEAAGDVAVFVGRRDDRAWAVAYDGDGDRLGSYRSSITESGYTAVTARLRDSGPELILAGYGGGDETTNGLVDRITTNDLDVGDGGEDGDGEDIRLLEIVGTEQGDVHYEFTVEGDAVRAWVTDRIKAEDEDDDQIRKNDDGTVTVWGSTGNEGYGDAFGFTGDVIEFDSSGDGGFFLRLDGDRVGVDELVDD